MKHLIWLMAALATLAASTAGAATGWGLRAGVTFDPDQVHVGAHVYAGELFDNGYFVPNVEVGFSDHLTLIALNPELVYRFDRRSASRWGFYVGGGLGVNIIKWDDGDDFPFDRHNDTDTDLGVNFLGGMLNRLSSGNEFFLELKLGVADSPDAKVTVGLTFF
jgi:hypothetical protein